VAPDLVSCGWEGGEVDRELPMFRLASALALVALIAGRAGAQQDVTPPVL